MNHSRNHQPVCGFCEGSGLWSDPDVDPGAPDPCPLCDGTGLAPASHPPLGPNATATAEAPLTLPRLLGVLPGMSQPDRQRLYEELHALYDCRIYRR